MRLPVLSILLFLGMISQAQPKLMVGIVVDQMRYEYLMRYKNDFGSSGFNKFLSEGFVYQNAHYNYTPTKTGPGHASVYSGTTPARHGIVGNDWYIRSLDRTMNCVEDTTVAAVGGHESKGKVSPRNHRTTTVTDELRLFYNLRSKVVGVSIKDRGACLPAGHNPTGAYWYDTKTGSMMTSTYYLNELPNWVKSFNKVEKWKDYLARTWDYFKDEETYTESMADQNEFEAEAWRGFGTTFPYDLKKGDGNPGLLKYSPFSNSFIREFAQKAIEAEGLGSDDISDFLTISFSAPDDLGHRFGPRSKEIQDVYLRLDQEIANLLSFLDSEVGAGNYTVFLTADHGAADVPSYLVNHKFPGGYNNIRYMQNQLNSQLGAIYGDGEWVSRIINDQVYLNHQLIKEKRYELREFQTKAAEILLIQEAVEETFPAHLVANRQFTDPFAKRLQNGFHRKRSGDVFYILASGRLNDTYGRKGTDHRTGYTYDTHIPILFYGLGIPTGTSVRPVKITDIAPTVSNLLKITLPSAATGQPLTELFE